MIRNSPLALERIALILAVAATSVAALAWGAPGMVAAAAGAALGCANLWALHRLAARAVARVIESGSSAGGLGAGAVFKTMTLFALLWVAVGVFNVAPEPFALGLSVVVVAPLAAGLRVALAEEAA